MTTDPTERRHKPRTGWRASWFGEVSGRLWYLVAYSDTTQTRFFLCITAMLWAAALALPGDSFSRPQFAYMRALASEGVWMLAFVLYAGAIFWRVFSDRRRQRIAMIVNAVGVTLFSSVAFSISTLPISPIPAGAAAHWAIALAALWVFVRTNINGWNGWRHD
jgi:hypothetical protein